MALTLYSMPSSGNSYKVRLLLAYLGRTYRHIACESGSPALAEAKRAGNAPTGKLPSLRLDDGTVLSESNAILWYLAQGTDWIPRDVVAQTQMLAWMFFEQNRHEPVIAVRASLRSYPERAASVTPARMAELLEAGHAVLEIMDRNLAQTAFFVGDRPNLADVALYAYTHSADTRGGYDVARFARIRTWLDRMAGLPGHVTLDAVPPEHG